MTKHIDDIISYVKQEIANGNEPKFYNYCPTAISNGITNEQISVITATDKKQKALITLADKQKNISCKSGLASLKRNNGIFYSLYGTHQFIDVNETISFTNSKGEEETLHSGDKIRLFVTIQKKKNKGLLIRSVAGISGNEFSKKYRLNKEITQLLEDARQAQKAIQSTLITASQNIK